MNIRRTRALVQIASLALIIAIPLLNMIGVHGISGTLYSLAIGPIWITDPLIGLQTLLIPLEVDFVLLASMIIPLVLASLFGRVFCSWVCPQNTLSELVDNAARAVGLKRIFTHNSNPLPRCLVLAFVVIMTPIAGIPLAGLLSAPGIISVQTAKYLYEGIVGLELGLIGLIILAEFFAVRRGWCMYICPVGTFLGLFRTRKTLSILFAEEGERVCAHCRECSAACPFGLDPATGGASSSLCHNCGDCISACEHVMGRKKPLNFSFPWRRKTP